MKTRIRSRSLLPIVLCSLLLSGCAVLEELGRNAGDGFIKGARDELNAPETQQALEGLVDGLGDSAGNQVVKLDSLLRDYTLPLISALRDDVLGDSTREQVRLLLDELAGEATQERLRALMNELLGEATQVQVGNIRNELLGEATRIQLGNMRDELIGEATNVAIQAIINGAVTTLSRSYTSEIRPVLMDDLDSIRSRLESGTTVVTGAARTLVWSLAGAIAFLIAVAGFFVWRYFRHRRMLKLVTAEIDAISNEDAKKELTERIKDRALETGLEPGLHKVIEQQRLEQVKA